MADAKTPANIPNTAATLTVGRPHWPDTAILQSIWFYSFVSSGLHGYGTLNHGASNKMLILLSVLAADPIERASLAVRIAHKLHTNIILSRTLYELENINLVIGFSYHSICKNINVRSITGIILKISIFLTVQPLSFVYDRNGNGTFFMYCEKTITKMMVLRSWKILFQSYSGQIIKTCNWQRWNAPIFPSHVARGSKKG